jgi:hypothetical protein
MSKLEELKKLKEAYETALAATAKDILQERAQAWFKQRPEALAICWRQYTPHFNDGDRCVFCVHDLYWTAKAEPDGDEYLEKDWRYAKEGLDLDDDILEPLGDGVRIVISRDLTMTVGDIDHD